MNNLAVNERTEEGFRYYLKQNGVKLKWHLSQEEDYLRSCHHYLTFYDRLYGRHLPENKNCKILEVGCAYGWFLYYLQQKGYNDFYGIDLSEEKINIISKYGVKKAKAADVFEFLEDKKETYDAIVLTYVLEHIPKPRVIEVLKLIRQSLCGGGGLIVTVPNMELPFSSRLRYLDFSHEIGFVMESLLYVLYQAGFDGLRAYEVPRTPRGFYAEMSYKVAKGVLGLFYKALLGQPPWLFSEGILAIGVK